MVPPQRIGLNENDPPRTGEGRAGGGWRACVLHGEGGSGPVRAYDRRPPEPDRPIGFRVERQRQVDGLARKRTEIDRSAFPAVHRRQRLLEHGFVCRAGPAHTHTKRQRAIFDHPERQVEPRAGPERGVERQRLGRPGHERFLVDLPEPLPADAGRNAREMLLTEDDADRFDLEVGSSLVRRHHDHMADAGRRDRRGAGQRVGLQLVSGHDRRLDPEGGSGEPRGQLGQVHLIAGLAGHLDPAAGRYAQANLDRVELVRRVEPVCALDAQHRCAARCPPDQTAVADGEVSDTRTRLEPTSLGKRLRIRRRPRRTATRSAGDSGSPRPHQIPHRAETDRRGGSRPVPAPHRIRWSAPTPSRPTDAARAAVDDPGPWFPRNGKPTVSEACLAAVEDPAVRSRAYRRRTGRSSAPSP